MAIDKILIDSLVGNALASPRRCQNYDLRISTEDDPQRMLKALLPGAQVPIHRHSNSNENVILLFGKTDEVIYEARTSVWGGWE